MEPALANSKTYVFSITDTSSQMVLRKSFWRSHGEEFRGHRVGFHSAHGGEQERVGSEVECLYHVRNPVKKLMGVRHFHPATELCHPTPVDSLKRDSGLPNIAPKA